MNTWTILVGQDEYDEDNIFLFKSIDKNSLGQGVLIDPNQAGYVNTKEFEPYESITHTSWDSLNHAGTLIKKDGSLGVILWGERREDGVLPVIVFPAVANMEEHPSYTGDDKIGLVAIKLLTL
jgi:hypothetical protein